MNERHPEATELDDPNENEIERIMNARGLPWAVAKRIVEGEPATENLQSARVEYERPYSVTRKPYRNRGYESRYDGEMAVGVDMSIPDERSVEERIEQAKINARGAAAVRLVLADNKNPADMTSQELAIYRAKRERSNRP